MSSLPRAAVVLALVAAACDFPRPADVPGSSDGGPGDASGSGDAADVPGDAAGPPDSTIHVSTTGDDASDGIASPVKTLKRAITLASANAQITTIALAAGRYSAATGEGFPYTVPAGVTIAGLSSGGTILAGTNAETGLIVDTGTLQDLELDDFAIAVAASTGRVELVRIHILDSALAVQGGGTAQLDAKNLDIVGSVTQCGAGLALIGGAGLVADTLSTHNLSNTLKATGSNIVNIAGADIVADPRCHCTGLMIKTGQTFKISDSSVVGCDLGLDVSGSVSSTTTAQIINTKWQKGDVAIDVSTGAVLQMLGGELSGYVHTAISFFGGSGSFANVNMINNMSSAIFVLGKSQSDVATITLRGCTVTGNMSGVFMFDWSAADLGTAANPGNNTFQNNQTVGVTIQGTVGVQQVDAIGNTWNPSVQGADPAGRYSVATISGPVASVAGNNYDIASGLSLRR
jgi:hypothetical protein